MNEIWKPIIGYENYYEVSNKGQIKNKKTGKILNGSLNNNGYKQVSLRKNNEGRTFLVHRIVAEAFIPNPDNKPVIDHIDTVKTNNAVDNLQWCTIKENNNNPITKKRLARASRQCTGKKVLCITTGKEFESKTAAARYYNVSTRCIADACLGKQKTAGEIPDGTRLTWKYID